MTHQTHLKKSGSGMSSRTACGRNILRTPMSLNWAGFSALPAGERCAKCNESKLAAFLIKQAAKQADDFGAWEPVADPDAWKRADDALIAAHRARTA